MRNRWVMKIHVFCMEKVEKLERGKKIVATSLQV